MTTRVYIGKLSSRTEDRDLENLFSKFGRVQKVDMKQGFAFVEMQDPRDAEDAIDALDGREVDGAKIVVEKSRGPRPKLNFRGRRTDHRVTVEDLPMDCSWQDLKDFAREAGRVIYADVYVKGGDKYGVIEYDNKEDMKYALRKLDREKIHGQRVRIVEQRASRSDSRPRRDYRSRSRDRGERRRDDDRRRDRYDDDRDEDRRGENREDDRDRDERDHRDRDRDRDRERERERDDREERAVPEEREARVADDDREERDDDRRRPREPIDD